MLPRGRELFRWKGNQSLKGSFIFLIFLLVLGACSFSSNALPYDLNPKNPVGITLWHYYNGPQKIAFDAMVTEFNETVGLEQGIIVEAYSKGDVSQLIDKIGESVNKKVGSEPVPHIFSAYADTAYAINKLGYVAALDTYMPPEELDAYVESYLEEGRLDQGGQLKIFPTAKSTEVLMMNQTDWEPFAEATGATLDNLATWEGVAATAEKYYNWTDQQTQKPDDGKAFFGRDAMANYMIVGCKQLGVEIFEVHNGEVTVNLDRSVMETLWNNFYTPYVRGYYGAYGKFRSDDVKTGNIIAFVGSTTGASYFPDQVTVNDLKSYSITSTVLPVPYFKDGEPVNVQQGAGMVVTKSDPTHEYASTVFLKWFTDAKRNIEFAVESGYLPVKKEANDMKVVEKVIEEKGMEVSDQLHHTLQIAISDVNSHPLYTNKAFDGGTKARSVLEKSLYEQAKRDAEQVQALMSEGLSKKDALERIDTEQQFEQWFVQLETDVHRAIGS